MHNLLEKYKTLVKIAWCFKDLDRLGVAPKASFRCKGGNIQQVTGKGYLEMIWVTVKVGSCGVMHYYTMRDTMVWCPV